MEDTLLPASWKTRIKSWWPNLLSLLILTGKELYAWLVGKAADIATQASPVAMENNETMSVGRWVAESSALYWIAVAFAIAGSWRMWRDKRRLESTFERIKTALQSENDVQRVADIMMRVKVDFPHGTVLNGSVVVHALMMGNDSTRTLGSVVAAAKALAGELSEGPQTRDHIKRVLGLLEHARCISVQRDDEDNDGNVQTLEITLLPMLSRVWLALNVDGAIQSASRTS
jgi:hypothetical protein